MVILKQQLPDIHFQVGIQRGQRLCSVEVDFGSWKKSTVSLQVLLFVLVFLTMFSRNYLGVHTPQDVLVGFISTAVMMYLTGWLELWSEKDKKRDLMILVAGLLICIAAVLYYEYKPYPLDYLPDGSLLVDPAKMRGDAYEGVGFIASFVICRILEKRQLDFDRISQKLRLFIGIFALIPLYWWINTGCPYIIEEISRSLGKFLRFGLGIIYIMVLVPGTVYWQEL